MFTFLTTEHKRRVESVYKTHLLIVFLIGMLTLMVLLILGLSPSFFIARSKKNAASTELSLTTQKVGADSIETIEKAIAESQEKVATSKEYLDKPYLTETLVNILKYKTSAIKINSLSFERSSQIILIGGVAQDRASLLEFVKKLRTDELFDVVDFPIASLVKAEKVDFNLTLYLKS